MPGLREKKRSSVRTGSSRSGGPPSVIWRAPAAGVRSQITDLLEETGVFRPDEIEVALEVFDEFCHAPDVDYSALGAFSGEGGEGELVGFAFYGATPCTVNTWDLYWIAVRPQHHGTGIGSGLMERVEVRMKSEGARLCMIETSARSDYDSTRRFYAACGYREVARVPDFYDVGDDRVTYVKRLDDE